MKREMPKYVAIVSLTNGLFFKMNSFFFKTKLDEGCCKNMTIKCKPTLLQTLLTYMQIDRERTQVWSISFWLHVRGLTESKISFHLQHKTEILLSFFVCVRAQHSRWNQFQRQIGPKGEDEPRGMPRKKANGERAQIDFRFTFPRRYGLLCIFQKNIAR